MHKARQFSNPTAGAPIGVSTARENGVGYNFKRQTEKKTTEGSGRVNVPWYGTDEIKFNQICGVRVYRRACSA